MKYQLICAAIVWSSCLLPAQMASHAPTKVASNSVSPAQLVTPPSSGKPVAKVNGTVLTDKDLLREMYTIFPYAKQHNGFPKSQEPQIRQGALQMIIFEELVYQDAVRRGVRIPADKIAAGEQAYKATFESPQQFQAYMKSEMNGSEQQFRKTIERSMIIDQVLRQEVDQKSAITAADLQAYYDKNPARFHVQESFTFQAISIVPPPGSTADQLKDAGKRAQEALKQAKATKSYEDFGLLAEKVSEDDFRVNMGDHKTVPADKLPPQVVEAFKTMKVGDVSGVIQIETAYTILRLNAHELAHKQSLAEVKAQLKVELQKQKAEQLRVSLDKRLRAKAKIEMS